MSRERPGAARSLLAAVMGLCLLALLQGSAEAGRKDRRERKRQESSVTEGGSQPRSEVTFSPGTRRIGGRIGAYRWRRQSGEPARMMIMTSPSRVSTGEVLSVTVRLNATSTDGKYASMSLGVDPAILEFDSFVPTGSGGLLVEPYPGLPGVVTIYRSALDEGFSLSEDLVTLKFKTMSAGGSLVILSDVRLLDRRARDLPVAFEAGEVWVE